MDKSKLSDGEWAKVLASLKKIVGIRIGCVVTCRQFVEAVLWILRCGAQWRCLWSEQINKLKVGSESFSDGRRRSPI